MCRILLAGVPQYGLAVNPQKVVLNFQVSGSAASCPDIRMLPPRCLFPWCGLLLDTHTLDVYKDYSRWKVHSSCNYTAQLLCYIVVSPWACCQGFIVYGWTLFLLINVSQFWHRWMILWSNKNLSVVLNVLLFLSFLAFFLVSQLCWTVSALQPYSGFIPLCRTADEKETNGYPQAQVSCPVLWLEGREQKYF